MTKKTDIEILAPVGSREMLKAAVLSNASAVYFGAGDFNARRNAGNFEPGELKSVIEYCHSRGVKVHITLNTLIKDKEVPKAAELIKQIALAGADAVIIQDLGVAKLFKEIAPSVPLHASTQLSTGTLQGLFLLKELGFSRAVLPRELSFDEIEKICASSPVEIEVFVHGALCMCVSGQCLMSALLGSRSGNRGLCAQPCRLPFKAEGGTGHDLSLKDLSLIEYIPRLYEAGVCSFKIEGRMKRPEYVSAAVSACRAAVSGSYGEDIRRDLENLFSRSGFTDGYYKKALGRNMFGFREKENVQSATKELLEKYSAVYEKETPRFRVDMSFSGEIGKNALLTARSEEKSVDIKSRVLCEKPLSHPIAADRITSALSKCGGTQFYAGDIALNKTPDYSLPVSALNEMRREALEALSSAISAKAAPEIFPYSKAVFVKSKNERKYYCRFDSLEQIPENTEGYTVFVPLSEYIKAENRRENLCAELPRGMFGNEEAVEKMLASCGCKKVLCHTADAVALAKKYGMEIVASPSMNIMNSCALEAAEKLGITEAVLSYECTLDDFAAVSALIPKGIAVYGRIGLMLTRNCPVKNGKTCSECKRQCAVTDRLNVSFPVRCTMGYSEILNSRPLYMADRQSEIPDCDILFFSFTTETKKEAEKILDAYRNALPPSGDFTRGLLYRGVE